MGSRTGPVAYQRTEGRAGERDSQQQRDETHSIYSFTGGRQPHEPGGSRKYPFRAFIRAKSILMTMPSAEEHLSRGWRGH